MMDDGIKKEVNDEIKKVENELKTEINRITKSTDANVQNLINQKTPIFYASMKCGICLTEKTFHDFNQVQERNNTWFISADMLNKVLGFAPDFKKIEELTMKMSKISDMVERDKVAKEIFFLKNNYASLPFVCFDCAETLQNEFIKVYDNLVKKKMNLSGPEDNEKELTTNIFSMGVSKEEKKMLTASKTSEVQNEKS